MQDSGTPPCITCDPPVSNQDVSVFTSYTQIMHMKFGPYGDTQALYYSGLPTTIRRVSYVGDGNRSPEAVILADPTEGPVGVQVQFSGAGSSDLDSDGLKFEWDFDGDGVIDSTAADEEYTYTSAGVYNAALTVSDGQGGKTTVKVEISVGNKPVPVITSPATGSAFAVGDIITLVGSATDEENGQLADTSLSWEVRQHHDTHYHPFLDATAGNNVVLQPAPEPEDYHAASNSYLEIILTATDSDGLSANVTVEVQPRLVNVDFDTVPSGLDLFLDGNPLTTPATATTWEGHSLHVDAPDQFIDGQAYVFSSWSNGGDQSHTIPIPPASTALPKFVAEFTQFSGTFAPTQAPSEQVKCLPCSLGIVAYGGGLVTGNASVNEECGIFTIQQNDGNLVVMLEPQIIPGMKFGIVMALRALKGTLETTTLCSRGTAIWSHDQEPLTIQAAPCLVSTTQGRKEITSLAPTVILSSFRSIKGEQPIQAERSGIRLLLPCLRTHRLWLLQPCLRRLRALLHTLPRLPVRFLPLQALS